MQIKVAGFLACDFLISIMHEALHQFGAKDFYYPQSLKILAETFFGESIMLAHSCDKIDPLTAYLIGWTNSVDFSTEAFLRTTSSYTQEDLYEACRKEWKK